MRAKTHSPSTPQTQVRNVKPVSLRSHMAFKEIEEGSPIAMYTCDRGGYITFFNKAAEQLWGRAPQIGIDRWSGGWKLYYPGGKPMSPEESPMARTLNEGVVFQGNELTIERPDHTLRYLQVYPHPIFNDNNEVTGAYNLLIDITEQKKNEARQEILSAIVESSDDAIISKTLDGVILTWNAGAERLLGYKENEAIGRNVSMFIPAALQEEESMIIQNIKNGIITDHYETVRMHKNGSEVNVSLTISPIKDVQGRVIGASKIARDITERIHREHLIKQGEESLAILKAFSKLIAEKMDVQDILQHVISTTVEITGAEFGAFFYKTINEYGAPLMLHSLTGVPPEAFDIFGLPKDLAVFHPTATGEGPIRINDTRLDARYGKNYPHYGLPPGYLPIVSYLAVPLISNEGAVIGQLSFGHPDANVFDTAHESMVINIASQAAVALENFNLFKEVKNLSAKKDEFIALASHELKTPLTTIKGYLQILNRNEKDEKPILFIKKAIDQVEKLDSLVTDLFDISKIERGKLQLNPETFDLRDLILEVIEMFHNTNQSHHIFFSYNNQAPVEADKRRIEQVIVNLLTNAIKYSPETDQVEIQLRKSDTHVTVAVQDKGIGITAYQQKHIFFKFYRAKGEINLPGLGLGLYISKDIIERHHGEMKVISELGKGSEFSFTLPLSPAIVEA